MDSNIFYRWDDDLTDWTYFSGDVNRTANPVDTKTFGFELVASKKWENFEAIASYSYLKKKEDYKKTDFVGSFYALNYPENRLTLGVIWDPIDSVQIRVDNEWRKQRKNAIRTGPDSAFNSHLAASYYPAKFNDLELFLAYDKPWDEEFQDIPGYTRTGRSVFLWCNLQLVDLLAWYVNGWVNDLSSYSLNNLGLFLRPNWKCFNWS